MAPVKPVAMKGLGRTSDRCKSSCASREVISNLSYNGNKWLWLILSVWPSLIQYFTLESFYLCNLVYNKVAKSAYKHETVIATFSLRYKFNVNKIAIAFETPLLLLHKYNCWFIIDQQSKEEEVLLIIKRKNRKTKALHWPQIPSCPVFHTPHPTADEYQGNQAPHLPQLSPTCGFNLYSQG